MIQDLKHAIRMLFQTKAWTIVVLLSLAIGIGANTALFTAVNGLLLQTVEATNPESLVKLKWAGDNNMVRNSSDYGFSQTFQGGNVRSTFSVSVYEELRKANQTLVDVFACFPIGGVNVVINNEADLAPALGTLGPYFQVLGVPAMLGRTLTIDDDKPGASAVAVISHGFWQRRFGADPNVVGRQVTINNQPFTVVGVTPAAYTGIQRLGDRAPDVTVSMTLESQMSVGQSRFTQPTNWYVQIVGRLKPGVTPEQVRANFEGVFHATARAGMDAYTNALTPEQRTLSTNRRDKFAVPRLLVLPAKSGIYDFDNQTATTTKYLAWVVGLLLLLVCANVATLLLSRATARRKEISIRLSMGAPRRRLVRQLLTESLVLSGLGGVLGVLVGYWSRQLLPFGQNVSIDWRVFAFVAGLSMLTGVIFGLVPAFRTTSVDLASSMKEESRSVSGTRSHLSKGLLVLQVSLSLLLLIGAGLFLKSVNNLRNVNIGFNPNNLLMFSINPALNRYDADRTAQLMAQVQRELQALPGARSVALSRVLLLSGSRSTSTMSLPGGTKEDTHMMSVSPEFFDTMEIPLLTGRQFGSTDTKSSPKVVVINEAAARKMFGNEPAVGRTFGSAPENTSEYQIVGVVGDAKYASLREPAPVTVFQLYSQYPVRSMNYVVRTHGDPSALIEPARAAVRRVDAAVPVTSVSTQTDQIERRFQQERLLANAMSLFGGLALLLSAIGLFGLMSFTVSRRINEIGIRMALGAQRGSVIAMVLRESSLLVGIGVAIGVTLGLALPAVIGRFITPLLFGTAVRDTMSIAIAVAMIVVVSTLAGYLPARRASRVDPMVALHRQ